MIEEDVLNVLLQSTFSGNSLHLPEGQLPRELYERVDRVLKRLRGNWKNKKFGHVFPYDPKPFIMDILENKIMPPDNPEAHYYTPTYVSDLMLQWDDLSWLNHPSMRILEPSAGQGHIADRLRLLLPKAQIDVVEVTPFYANLLRKKGYNPHEVDFLQFNPDYKYDLIVMNPPFAVPGNGHAYIDHTLHAFSMLKEKRSMVTITPMGWTFRSDKKSTNFRNFVYEYGNWIEELGAGAFKEAGTGVATTIIELENDNWKRKEKDGFNSWHTWIVALYRDNTEFLSDRFYNILKQIKEGTKDKAAIRKFWEEVVDECRKYGEMVILNDEDHNCLYDFTVNYEN